MPTVSVIPQCERLVIPKQRQVSRLVDNPDLFADIDVVKNRAPLLSLERVFGLPETYITGYDVYGLTNWDTVMDPFDAASPRDLALQALRNEVILSQTQIVYLLRNFGPRFIPNNTVGMFVCHMGVELGYCVVWICKYRAYQEYFVQVFPVDYGRAEWISNMKYRVFVPNL